MKLCLLMVMEGHCLNSTTKDNIVKKYKKVIKPSKELESVTCDICKMDIAQMRPPKTKNVNYKEHLSFFTDPNDDDITVERSIRASFGYADGGGESVHYKWDICPDCFESVVVKAIEDAGGSPTIESYEY